MILTIVKCFVYLDPGPISFTEGKRTDFKLDLLKLEHDKMKKVGDWNPIQGLNITDPYAFMQGKS
jgi:ionotropic glutamate receptor